MCIESFLSKIAEEHSLSFSDLEKEFFKTFFDADPLDLASTEDCEKFLREHEIKRVSNNSMILYLKRVKMSEFCCDLSFRLRSLELDSVKNKKQIYDLNFSVGLLFGVLAVSVIIRYCL